jgi:hypothetical protein
MPDETTSAAMPATTTPPSRKRRWLRRLLIALVIIVGLPAAYYWYAHWSLAHDLDDAIGETDQLDPRWRLRDIEADRKPIADEHNAALHVISVVRLLGRNAPADHPDYTAVFEKNLTVLAQLNAQQIDILREAYEKMPEAFVEARKLKDMPAGRFPLTFRPLWIDTLLPNHQDARRVISLLAHDAMWRVQQGDSDAALESCIALVNVSRAMGDEPLLITFLIRVNGLDALTTAVERCLAQGQPGDAVMKELQTLLPSARAARRAQFRSAVRGERAGHQQMFEAMGRERVPFSSLRAIRKGDYGSEMKAWLWDRFPVLHARGYPKHLRHMNKLVAAAQLPPEQQLERFTALDKELDRDVVFSDIFAPNMLVVCRANLRTEASLSALEAGLACERFRLTKTRWPESLGELVQAKLLDAVPIDPFDGQPLRLTRRQEGLVAYSVGYDLQDDGGNVDRIRPLDPGSDIGFRLWDPPQRRQPPRPPVMVER